MKLLLTLIALVLPSTSSAQEVLEWHRIKAPTQRASNIYGSYYAGCMDGGIKLPSSGDGYIRKGKRYKRTYGQPVLIDYINKFGRKVHSEIDRTLVIGDLAGPRGGPAPIGSSLHQSHQNGLDVDIWLRSAKPNENARKITQASMLNKNKTKINKKYWNVDTAEILKTAASFSEVDRIFINPVIKKELCRNHANALWMKKIRSWWGHSSHFHVRLKCPKDNAECVKQKPVPNSFGCGEDLAWWFSEESSTSTTYKARKYPELPQECKVVFLGE